MKKILVILITLIFALSFSAMGISCKEEETAASQEEVVEEAMEEEVEAEPLLIGRIIPFEEEFQKTLTEHAKIYAEANNMEVVIGNYEGDLEKERRIMEDFIAKGVDGIIIQTRTAEEAREMNNLARDAGIPIVILVVPPDEEPYVCVTIGAKEAAYDLGVLAGETALEYFPDQNIVLGNMFLPTHEYAMENKTKPFNEGFQSAVPDAEIIMQPAEDLSTEGVVSTTEDMMTANPEINVVTGTIGLITMVAHNTLLAMGRGTTDTEIVIGAEGSIDEYIKWITPDSNYMYAAAYGPKDEEYAAWDALLKLMSGEISMDETEIFFFLAKAISTPEQNRTFLEEQWLIDVDEAVEKALGE